MAVAEQRALAAQEEARDLRVERDLDKLHIEYALVMKVPPGSFDREASLANQVRMGKALDRATVEKYGEALRGGAVFPPLSVQRQSDGRYLVLDGNHRLEAHTRQDKPMNVYVCSAPPAVLVRYSFEANAKHGLPASDDDRLHHALYLVDSGMSVREAAQQFQIPMSRLQTASLAVQSSRRADDLGIPRAVFGRLPRTTQARINAIRTDEGFVSAAQLAVDANLRTQDVEALLRDLSEVRGSASKQLAVVARWRETLRPQIAVKDAGSSNRRGGNPFNSPKSRLRSGIAQLTPLDPKAMAEVPPIERPDLAKEVRAAIERLRGIATFLEAK